MPSRWRRPKPREGVKLASIKSQAAEYASVMGRPWNEPHPTYAEYGFDIPKPEIATAEFVAWYHRLTDWLATPDGERYAAAARRAAERRAQFMYSPRARDRKDVLARAQAA